MKKTVLLEFDCGNTTCVDPDTRACCRYLGSKRMGLIPVCLLFRDSDGTEIELGLTQGVPEDRQWRLRCAECLQQAKSAPEDLFF
jgi:hypothetical protein